MYAAAEYTVDIALWVGGNIRTAADAGEIICRTLCPWNNVVCPVRGTGRQILDGSGLTQGGETGDMMPDKDLSWAEFARIPAGLWQSGPQKNSSGAGPFDCGKSAQICAFYFGFPIVFLPLICYNYLYQETEVS